MDIKHRNEYPASAQTLFFKELAPGEVFVLKFGPSTPILFMKTSLEAMAVRLPDGFNCELASERIVQRVIGSFVWTEIV